MQSYARDRNFSRKQSRYSLIEATFRKPLAAQVFDNGENYKEVVQHMGLFLKTEESHGPCCRALHISSEMLTHWSIRLSSKYLALVCKL